jgi:hypothetical protein
MGNTVQLLIYSLLSLLDSSSPKREAMYAFLVVVSL